MPCSVPCRRLRACLAVSRHVSSHAQPHVPHAATLQACPHTVWLNLESVDARVLAALDAGTRRIWYMVGTGSGH